jgi:hypothetical protein
MKCLDGDEEVYLMQTTEKTISKAPASELWIE